MGITLVKGQRISLSKPGEPGLSKVFCGLGWDVAPVAAGGIGGLFGKKKEGPAIDLDASALLFDANKQLVDVVWFRQLQSKDGSIKHSGDNRSGAGDGDDEVIHVELSRVPEAVQTLVFTVNSFTGQNFNTVANSYCRIVDSTSNVELARFDLGARGEHTALILAKLYRHNGDWKMHAIGETASGKTVGDLLPAIAGSL